MAHKKKDIISECFTGTLVAIFLSLVSVALGNAIDGIIVGRFLGEQSLSAFGLTTPYQKFVSINPLVISIGMRLLCAEKLGKSKLDEANGIFSLSVITTMCHSAMMIAATFLFPELLADLLNATPNLGEVRRETIEYLQTYVIGLPAVAMVSILTPVMQFDDDKKRSVVAVTLLSVVNVVGDLVSIFVFDAGIFGIGLVTSISYYITTAYLMLHFLKKTAQFKFTLKNINFAHLLEMHASGSSAMLGRLSSMTNSGFLNRLAVKYSGINGVASFTAVSNITSLMDSAPKALSTSMQMVLGLLVSAQDKKTILRLMRKALRYSIAVSAVTALLLILTSPIMASFYTSETEVATRGLIVDGLFWVALSLPASFIYAMMQYFYQTFKHYKLINFMALANNIVYIIPLGLLLTPFLGLTGLWLTLLLNQIYQSWLWLFMSGMSIKKLLSSWKTTCLCLKVLMCLTICKWIPQLTI